MPETVFMYLYTMSLYITMQVDHKDKRENNHFDFDHFWPVCFLFRFCSLSSVIISCVQAACYNDWLTNLFFGTEGLYDTDKLIRLAKTIMIRLYVEETTKTH